MVGKSLVDWFLSLKSHERFVGRFVQTSHEHLQRLVQATGQWRPPCRWIVRKSVNPFNTQ